MKLEKYIKKAKETESKLENIKGNPQLVVNLLTVFTAAGRMLDQLKKHTFYGKEYDIEKFNFDYQTIINTLQHLAVIPISGSDEQMEEITITEINPRLFHAIIGIATEATELCEALYKVFTHTEVVDSDLVINLREESTDLNWYQAIFYDTLRELGYEASWSDDLDLNIKKLEKRYRKTGKLKFTSDAAINRDLKAERKILEKAK